MLEVRNVRIGLSKDFSLSIPHLEVRRQSIAALLGPSGCGKTSLLRIIAGLQRGEGEIFLEGRELSELPAHERRIGMVFQDYALFPHLNVFENIAYGLRASGWKKATMERRVGEMLELVRLPQAQRRNIFTLSGGERQRVAIARALAPSPKALLLDEPFSALDEAIKEEIRHHLIQIRSEFGIPILFVTHDQRDAVSLADNIGILRNGELIEWNRSEEIYFRPKFYQTAVYFSDNVLLATIPSPENLQEATTPFGVISLSEPAPSENARWLCFKPWEISLQPREEHGDTVAQNFFPAELRQVELHGQMYHYRVALRGQGDGTIVEVHVNAAEHRELIGINSFWVIFPADRGHWLLS